MWQPRNFTLEGKIIIFKALDLLKFLFLSQILSIPDEVTTTIQRIQKEFQQCQHYAQNYLQ